ncbi:MAG TPA: alpha-glucan family phosphorylase [Polyangia bacterium]
MTAFPPLVAYFSMEVALAPGIPTYAGGLGVLAGDMLRSCADLGELVIGVTLVHRLGYFHQRLSPQGDQSEEPCPWRPEEHAVRCTPTVEVTIEGRPVKIGLWRYEIRGSGGHVVPVLLLDSDLPENAPSDRQLTNWLYGDGESYRIAQEVILGIGGVRALHALGFSQLQTFHLNEGHAAFAGLELLRQESQKSLAWDVDAVRKRCVFTTHTPVPAGHDQFFHDLVRRIVGDVVPPELLRRLGGDGVLNMTLLALNLSHYVNGVARAHRNVSEHLFPGHAIGHITNGVHAATWTAAPFRDLYDRHLPGWRDDPALLRQVLAMAPDPIWQAHVAAKQALLAEVKTRTGRTLDPERLTLGFARRSTAYKRPDLLFRDLERLRRMGRGRLQIVYAGKAHPRDEAGKSLIRRITAAARALGDDVPIVYLPDYDVELAKFLVSGVDLWLNTPLRPLEASGTSGMKAAHNGVPSFSVLDGWWVEGCIEGLTGWAIGGSYDPALSAADADRDDAADLYTKLESTILPLFTGDRSRWVSVMQHAIALNASYFNSHRMVQQYIANAYM